MKTSNDFCAPTTTHHRRENVARIPWCGPGLTLGSMLRPVLALCTLTALTFGCHAGEPVGEPADLDSARAGWHSVELVMDEIGVDVQWGSSSVTVDDNGSFAMATGTMPCPEGGILKLVTDTQVTDYISAAYLELEFDGCGADGVVIDGHLETATEVTDTKSSSSIAGHLSFSGDAHGTCEIDIETIVTDDSASSHASVCGFGYDALFG